METQNLHFVKFYANNRSIMVTESSNAGISQRLRRLRQIAGLKRDQLAYLTGVTPQTISVWENSEGRIITRKNLEKLMDVFKDRKVICDVNWILYGTGSGPVILSNEDDLICKHTEILANLPSDLKQEISLFIRLNVNSVITRIEDSSMNPVFQRNDIVGGIWQEIKIIEKDSICIFEQNGSLEVRKIIKKTFPHDLYFDASFLTLCENAKPFLVENIKIQKAAPIIRIWRNLPLI